jgi:hypothetical protein
MATHETAHLIVVAPKELEKRLKEIGTRLEAHYDTAYKVLFKPKEVAWPGKLTVFLFAEPEHLDAFIRRVEKRRLVGVEKGTFIAEDDRLFAAATGLREKGDPALEVQAAQQVASALLMRRAGPKTPVPFWLVSGFGRATHYRAPGPVDRDVPAERRGAARLVARNKRTAQDVWGGVVEGEEVIPLQASLADFLAYGPGKAKFPALLDGFKPEENVTRKTMQQALDAAGLKADTINTVWRRWVVSPR